VTQIVAKPSLLQVQKPAAMKFKMIRQITTTKSKHVHAKKIKLAEEDMDFNKIPGKSKTYRQKF
jgi:hypothetical protein